MIPPPRRGLRGFLIDAPVRGRLRGVRDGALLIEDGVIVAAGPFEEVRQSPDAARARWLHSPETVIVPGLIDLHAEPARHPAVARGAAAADFWRERWGEPFDHAFSRATAEREAPLFLEDLARNGTTCAVLEVAASEASCDAVFAAAERHGIRIILAQGGAAEQAERLCRRWHGRDRGRLESGFVAPPADAGRRSETALLARKFDAFLLARIDSPTDWIEEAGPRAVFRVNPRLADVPAGSAVALAPAADLFLDRGVAPLNEWTAAGARCGLASEVGAGPELGLWPTARALLDAQKARALLLGGGEPPLPAEAFHLATLGGARALGKESALGTLDVGKDADVVVLDLAAVLPYGTRGNMHADLAAAEIIALLVYRGGPAAVIETFVRGQSVYRAPAPGLL